MKYVVLLILLFSVLIGNAQIPSIKSNVMDEMKNNSLIYKTFLNKYDFLIAYYTHSGWRIGNLNYISILALKNKSWKKITLTYPDNKPAQLKLKKEAFKKENAEKLMKDLGNQNFWALSNDSLNIREIKPKTIAENHAKNDTLFIVANIIRRVSVVDGAAYYFEVLQGNNLRLCYSDNPEVRLEVFPEIKSALNFIKSRNAFEKALKN